MMSATEFARYDALEKNYWWFKARRKILEVFLLQIPETERKSLLEVGCGTGGNLRYLFSGFQTRIGIDFDPGALGYAAQKLRTTATLIRGDANHLSLLRESVDCIAMLDLLYHRNILDVEVVLRQAYAALSSHGYLLITDGAFRVLQGKHNEAVQAARRFTRQELVGMLHRSGYHIIKASYWGFVLFFLLFLKRAMFEKLVPTSEKNADTYDLVKIPVLDSLLYWCVQSEQHVLKKYSLPLGASIAILAQKA